MFGFKEALIIQRTNTPFEKALVNKASSWLAILLIFILLGNTVCIPRLHITVNQSYVLSQVHFGFSVDQDQLVVPIPPISSKITKQTVPPVLDIFQNSKKSRLLSSLIPAHSWSGHLVNNQIPLCVLDSLFPFHFFF